MADLSGVRIKIERAKKHFSDLETAIHSFELRWPYTIKTETDSNTGNEINKFYLNKPIPGEWGAILGDCIHNLRSALDLLAVELVRAGGGVPGDYTAFPIGSDRTYFESSGITRLNGATAEAIKLVRRLKPYYRGCDALWRLHRLDIADKHQLLIPVAAAHKEFGVEYDIRGPGLQRIVQPLFRGPVADRKLPLKNGDVLIGYQRLRADGFEDQTKFHFAFEIAFGEGQIFDGETVVPTLRELGQFTERIIDIFARRILKIPW